MTSFLCSCVIPTSLHVLEQPANYAPVLVTDLCTPALEGPISPGTLGTSPIVAPHLVVDDVDAATGESNNHVPETLTARIFKLNTATNALVFLPGLETRLANANPLSPTRYVGDFTGVDWCATYTSGSVDLNIVVIVADREFEAIGSGHEDQLKTDRGDGGVSVNQSRSGWRLHCQ